jgi:hypothetical protein
VPVKEQLTGGDDKTMWCRSIASGAIDLNQELPDDIWQGLVPPRKASDRGETITLRYVEGIPVELNGRTLGLDEVIAQLNVIAGRNGIGYIDMFEDGIMDLKSREIYEAPAAHVGGEPVAHFPAQLGRKMRDALDRIVADEQSGDVVLAPAHRRQRGLRFLLCGGGWAVRGGRQRCQRRPGKLPPVEPIHEHAPSMDAASGLRRRGYHAKAPTGTV